MIIQNKMNNLIFIWIFEAILIIINIIAIFYLLIIMDFIYSIIINIYRNSIGVVKFGSRNYLLKNFLKELV
jgi:hypothetical protein